MNGCENSVLMKSPSSSMRGSGKQNKIPSERESPGLSGSDLRRTRPPGVVLGALKKFHLNWSWLHLKCPTLKISHLS